jgi:hypothetical protein
MVWVQRRRLLRLTGEKYVCPRKCSSLHFAYRFAVQEFGHAVVLRPLNPNVAWFARLRFVVRLL